MCGVVGFIIVLLPPSIKKCLFCLCTNTWTTEIHSEDLKYYDAQNIFTADEKYIFDLFAYTFTLE